MVGFIAVAIFKRTENPVCGQAGSDAGGGGGSVMVIVVQPAVIKVAAVTGGQQANSVPAPPVVPATKPIDIPPRELMH